MVFLAIPVCGAGNPAYAPQLTDVSVWAFHGAKYKNVPVEGSRAMINALKQVGGPRVIPSLREGRIPFGQMWKRPLAC